MEMIDGCSLARSLEDAFDVVRDDIDDEEVYNRQYKRTCGHLLINRHADSNGRRNG